MTLVAPITQVIVVGIILVLMLVPVLTAVREQGAVQEPEGPTLDWLMDPKATGGSGQRRLRSWPLLSSIIVLRQVELL